MEFNYSKKTLRSVLKSIGYFALWGLAFEITLFLILWYLTKWDFKQLLTNPYMSPFGTFKIWIILGAIHGWLRRKKKSRAMTIKKWGRIFVYMLFFGGFVMSLQLYYVHRKNTGYYDIADATCLNKYHSFWLITDIIYYKNTDTCLRNLKAAQRDANGQPIYTPIHYISNNDGNYKTEFIDYDVITPRILWILIVFCIITLIELLRRYGPVSFYKGLIKYGHYWQRGLSQLNTKKYEILFFGATLNLVWLAFMPKINGYPSKQLPILLFLAAGFFMLRMFFTGIMRRPTQNNEFSNLFLFSIGIALSNLLLVLLGAQTLYYLLFICLIVFLVLFRKVSVAQISPLLLFMLLLDPEFLLADDGTWPEGGLDRLAADTAGPMSIGNTEDLAEAVVVTVPFAEIHDDFDEDENEEDEYFDEDGDMIFPGETDTENSDTQDNDDTDTGNEEDDNDDNDDDDDDDGPVIINRPLGEPLAGGD